MGKQEIGLTFNFLKFKWTLVSYSPPLIWKEKTGIISKIYYYHFIFAKSFSTTFLFYIFLLDGCFFFFLFF